MLKSPVRTSTETASTNQANRCWPLWYYSSLLFIQYFRSWLYRTEAEGYKSFHTTPWSITGIHALFIQHCSLAFWMQVKFKPVWTLCVKVKSWQTGYMVIKAQRMGCLGLVTQTSPDNVTGTSHRQYFDRFCWFYSLIIMKIGMIICIKIPTML